MERRDDKPARIVHADQAYRQKKQGGRWTVQRLLQGFRVRVVVYDLPRVEASVGPRMTPSTQMTMMMMQHWRFLASFW